MPGRVSCTPGAPRSGRSPAPAAGEQALAPGWRRGRLEQVNGVRLEVRTGVNTGAVVASGDRAGGAFATGGAVNTAARLEQAAPPGQVLLGASTYRLVRDAVVVEPLPALLVKGNAEPLLAYRLLKVLDVAQGRAPQAAVCNVGVDRFRREELLSQVEPQACSHGGARCWPSSWFWCTGSKPLWSSLAIPTGAAQSKSPRLLPKG